MSTRTSRMIGLPFIFLAGALAAAGAPDVSMSSPGATVPGYIKVLEPRARISIDSPRITFYTGNHVPLIQENDEYFIALVDTPYQGKRLCAFPLQTREGPSAWVSRENELFFAYTTASCQGRLYLREGELLPVLGETRDAWEVVVERFGRRAKIEIPKGLRGVQFVKPPPPPKKPVRPAPVFKPAPVLPPATNPPAPAQAPPPAPPETEEEGGWLYKWIAGILSGMKTPEQPKPEAPALAPAPIATTAAQTAAAAGNVTQAPTSVQTAAQAELPKAIATFPEKEEEAAEGGVGYPSLAMILVLIAVIAAGLYLNQRRRKARGARAAGSGAMPPVPEIPEGMSDDQGHGDFSGSISSVSLSSVAQFLNANRESGMLDVKDPNGTHVGALIFVNGDILDAHARGKRGADAVYNVLRRKDGSFAFVRTSELRPQPTITENTITLLLNAHKQMDEENSPGAGT